MSLAEMERLNEVDPDFGMLSTLTAYTADLGRFDARIAQARTHAVAAGDHANSHRGPGNASGRSP